LIDAAKLRRITYRLWNFGGRLQGAKRFLVHF
jgi:hypothetical protein